MCTTNKAQRDNQLDLADGLGDAPIDDIALPCQQNQAPVPVKLLTLTLQGAEAGGPRPWAVVDPVAVFTAVATTTPANTAVVWTGEQNPGAVRADVARSVVLDRHVVTASLAGKTKSLTLDVIDLLTLEHHSPEVFDDGNGAWKTYECKTKALVRATTNPALATVWKRLVWSDDSAGSGNGQVAKVDRTWPPAKADDSTVELRTITVTLGTINPKVLTHSLRVCRWPKLKLLEVSFPTSRAVINDGVAEFGAAFDRRWEEGRPAPAANLATATCQSIICMHGGAQLQVAAVFTVERKPTDTETVTITGKATVGGVPLTWTQDLDVAPGDDQVVFPAIDADVVLAAGVAAPATLKIDWTMDAPALLYADGRRDAPAKLGRSENLFYATLGAPGGTAMYWTLLDLSCKGAAGTATEAAFVPAAFAPLKNSTGNGKGIRRKGDGIRMSYYKQGWDTAASNDTYTTAGILGSIHATGRCGGWKNLLIHMFNMHGVNSAVQYACVRKTHDDVNDMYLRFIVNHGKCPSAANPAALPYRNFGTTLIKKDGVKGQGKTNPQFDFGDHVTVLHNNQIYDPSYGIGPIANSLAYEKLAIGAFGLFGNGDYHVFSDTTPQKISQFIDADCLFDHVTVANDTMTTIAAQYGCTEPILRKRNRVLLLPYNYNALLPVGLTVIVPLPATQARLKWT